MLLTGANYLDDVHQSCYNICSIHIVQHSMYGWYLLLTSWTYLMLKTVTYLFLNVFKNIKESKWTLKLSYEDHFFGMPFQLSILFSIFSCFGHWWLLVHQVTHVVRWDQLMNTVSFTIIELHTSCWLSAEFFSKLAIFHKKSG